MRKLIGKEGTEQGQFNVMRLYQELETAGVTIELFEIMPAGSEEEGNIYITFPNEQEETVTATCAAHKPEPLPTPPTEMEEVKAEMVKLYDKHEDDKTQMQLAVAEAVEMIVAMMGGGE